ncbi:DUF6058 family natural product biosynthesis protein [Yinghuangia soli]|uniref:DUF6058 family natural product biosynthesis protein n=1 Tax=Yinghuangia soli TaxID=2908204 RepID=A0AA41PZK1_9ACTN|nr:DUF6058 family natural product biosynthesis protein [Yinghuangia soli]MCF2527337.1 DUF6058 family natural product biosynthesis protein [Yinghuangia soli]
MQDLQHRIAARFRDINGNHPMTPDDDAYVTRQFVPLEILCARTGHAPDEVRQLMLDGSLPLPGYLRSDGAEMVPTDLFALADRAGGVARLRAWFVAQWPGNAATGTEEWDAYTSGQYVCLHAVSPETIRRKAQLTTAISASLAAPLPRDAAWLTALHRMVDELDALETDFTAYDRLRFGAPTSRDTCIDAVRAQHPRA